MDIVHFVIIVLIDKYDMIKRRLYFQQATVKIK